MWVANWKNGYLYGYGEKFVFNNKGYAIGYNNLLYKEGEDKECNSEINGCWRWACHPNKNDEFIDTFGDDVDHTDNMYNNSGDCQL